jgi:hypothetical protein
MRPRLAVGERSCVRTRSTRRTAWNARALASVGGRLRPICHHPVAAGSQSGANYLLSLVRITSVSCANDSGPSSVKPWDSASGAPNSIEPTSRCCHTDSGNCDASQSALNPTPSRQGTKAMSRLRASLAPSWISHRLIEALRKVLPKLVCPTLVSAPPILTRREGVAKFLEPVGWVRRYSALLG